MFILIRTMVLILTAICVAVMAYRFFGQKKVNLSLQEYLKLIGSGVLAFISDCLGLGSFAVNIALAKLLNTFSDEELPAMVNGAQIIPGALESIFFMQVIDVDIKTLVALVAGTCLGGLLGGSVVSKLSQQAIRIAMIVCFSLIITLLFIKQCHLLPLGGNLNALLGYKLWLGFFGMMVCGSLTCVGIGLFSLVQALLFLLGVSPAVAFPIMTTAGAMQQPLTTLVFLKEDKIPLKKTFILSFGGCLGVLCILPVFKYFSTSWLHSLLIVILTYNLLSIAKAFFKQRNPEDTYATAKNDLTAPCR